MSIPRFLCPALSRSVRTARSAINRSNDPLVKNLDKLESYIRSLQNKVKAKSLGRKQRQSDEDLSDAEVKDVYLSLKGPEQQKLPAPRSVLTSSLCKRLAIAQDDDQRSLDWVSITKTLDATTLRPTEVSAILSVMPHNQRVLAGRTLFDATKSPSILSHDLLMDSYATLGNALAALEMFDRLRRFTTPTIYSYAHLMKAFAVTRDLPRATALYKFLQTSKIAPNLVIYTSLMTCCVRCGHYNEAFEIFDTMKFTSLNTKPDVQTYTLLIHACSLDSTKSAERAADLFQELLASNLRPTKETYHALMRVYATRPDYFVECWSLVERMQEEGHQIDKLTYHALLKACVTAKDLVKARKLVREMERIGITDAITWHFLLRVYACAKVRRTGNTVEASTDWLDEEVSDALVIYETGRIVERLERENAMNGQLYDTYLTMLSKFNHRFKEHYLRFSKSEYSLDIAISHAHATKDLPFLESLWTPKMNAKSTLKYVSALAVCNELSKATDLLKECGYTYTKPELRVFQTKSVQLENQAAMDWYEETFP